MRWAIVSPASVLALSLSSAALAQTGSVHIDYAAPPVCPSERAFRERLDARIREAPAEPTGRSLRALTVRVAARDGGFAGELRVRDADDEESVRRVNAPTCDELLDALAFLSALSMGIVTREPAIRTPTPAAAPASPDPPPPSEGERLAPVEPSRRGFSIGAGAATSSHVGPVVGFGEEAFVEVSYQRESFFALVLRLSGSRIAGASIDAAGGGSASLTLTSVRVEGCPLRVRPVRTLALLPCLGARVGSLHGDASAIERAHSDTELWVAAELLGRVQWAPLVSWLALEAEVGASAPFSRYEFAFAPSRTLSKTPVLGWFSAAGLAVRFP